MSEEIRRRVLDIALRRLRRTRNSRWAWQHLCECLWPFVNSITRRVANDPTLAEDAAQEVFIRLAKYAPFEKVGSPEVFQSYVATVAMNAAHDQNRRRSERTRYEEPMTEALVSRAAVGPSPQDEAEIRDLALWIVSRLSPKEQTLLEETLRGTTLQVIADQTNTKYSTVAVRLSRLRSKLRALFSGSTKKTRTS